MRVVAVVRIGGVAVVRVGGAMTQYSTQKWTRMVMHGQHSHDRILINDAAN